MKREMLTQAAYARRRGVTREAVRLAVQAGRIRLVDGKVDARAADREWKQNTNEEKAHRAGANGKVARAPAAGTGLAKHRASHENWKAKLAELEYRKEAGELGEVKKMESVVFADNRRCRDRLRLIETRLGPMLPPEVLAMLRKEIQDACNELSS